MSAARLEPVLGLVVLALWVGAAGILFIASARVANPPARHRKGERP